MSQPNAEQVRAWLEKQAKVCDEAIEEAKQRSAEYGEAKRLYKVAHAKALLLAKRQGYQSEGDTKAVKLSSVKEAEAVADLVTGDELAAYVEAECLYQTAIEAARNKRTQLSSVQTYVGMVRSEMELVSRGPQVTP